MDTNRSKAYRVGKFLLFLLPLLFFSCEEHTSHDNKTINVKQVAVEGFDLVAYYEDGKGVPGNSLHSVPIDDVVYYFSSRKNQELFERELS